MKTDYNKLDFNYTNYTDLHIAVKKGDIGMVRSILTESNLEYIQARTADSDQHTALDIAIDMGRTDIVQEIARHEAILTDLSTQLETMLQGQQEIGALITRTAGLQFSSPLRVITLHGHEESSSLHGDSDDTCSCSIF